MYEEFFGFSKDPFHVTPDTDFFYPEGPYEDAMSRLLYGVEHGKGFVLLTGPSGSGKTMMCRILENRLEPETTTALMLQTRVNAQELLEGVLEQFGLDCPPDSTPKQMLDRLRDFLIEEFQNNKNVCIILDECQQLSPEVLENLRLLSNLETEKDKLLQIVMVGQPDLDQYLKQDDLRQIDQRIAVRARLRYLTRSETREYVRHRIKQAGVTESLTIEDRFFHGLYEASQGNPRIINTLCNRALREAYEQGSLLLNLRYLNVAMNERTPITKPDKKTVSPWNQWLGNILDFTSAARTWFRERPVWAAGLLVAFLIASGIGYWSYHTRQDPRNMIGEFKTYFQSWKQSTREQTANASTRSGARSTGSENRTVHSEEGTSISSSSPAVVKKNRSPGVEKDTVTSRSEKTSLKPDPSTESQVKTASISKEPAQPTTRQSPSAPNPLDIDYLQSGSSTNDRPEIGALILARYLSYQLARAGDPPIDPSNRAIYRLKLEYSLDDLVPRYLPGQWITLRQSPGSLNTYGFPGFMTWEDQEQGRRTVLYFPSEDVLWDPYGGHMDADKQRLRKHWNGDVRILLRSGFDPTHMFNHKTRGVDVSRLQSLLNEVGNYGITPDGIYGTKTTSSVRDFQQKEGLKADGISGQSTNLTLLSKFVGGFPWSKYEVEKFLDKIQPGGASS